MTKSINTALNFWAIHISRRATWTPFSGKVTTVLKHFTEVGKSWVKGVEGTIGLLFAITKTFNLGRGMTGIHDVRVDALSWLVAKGSQGTGDEKSSKDESKGVHVV